MSAAPTYSIAEIHRRYGMPPWKEESCSSAEADPAELATLLAAPFAEWLYLSAAQKRRILAAAVEWISVSRPGRAQASVEAVRLRLPAGGPATTPRGPDRGLWAAWGDGLSVMLQ